MKTRNQINEANGFTTGAHFFDPFFVVEDARLTYRAWNYTLARLVKDGAVEIKSTDLPETNNGDLTQ